MRMSQQFPSKYLKAADLDGKQIKVTIDHVAREDIGDDSDKPVLYFAGKEKGLVLNRTNASVIVEAYGDETDNWAGSEILLYDTKVQFQSRMVDAIRVKIPKRPVGSPAVAKPVPRYPPIVHPQVHTEIDPPPHPGQPLDEILDDDVPF